MSYTPRLKEKYRGEIMQTLQERFGYKSVMSVPKLEKIVLSQGMGDAVADKKLIDSAAADLSRIAGQKAITTLSKNIPDSSRVETAWIYGRLVFDGDSFEALAEKMERWYNIKITIQNQSISKNRFSGVFEKENVPGGKL